MELTQKEIAAVYQPLFNKLSEFGIIALQSEMDEIIKAADQVKANSQQLMEGSQKETTSQKK